MFRLTGTAVAAILAMAVAALPLMLDRCTESCDAHQSATAAPPCHHVTATGTHITKAGVMRPDHDATAVTAPKNSASTGRTFALFATANSPGSTASPAVASARFEPHASLDCSPRLSGRSLLLRV